MPPSPLYAVKALTGRKGGRWHDATLPHPTPSLKTSGEYFLKEKTERKRDIWGGGEVPPLDLA